MPSRKREQPLAFLLIDAGASVRHQLSATLAASGLRPRHLQLLSHLADAGSSSQQDLLPALTIDASVLVGLLNDLEREGLVRRERDPADRRRHIVELSDRGRNELAKMAAKIASVDAALLDGVGSADRAVLRKVLQAVSDNGRGDHVC